MECRVTVIIAAHNEQADIGNTLVALARQTRPADRILVACDNCTDETESIAKSHGVATMCTVANTAKKAGALNQALAQELPQLNDHDFVVAMDADIELAPDFISSALAHFEQRPELGAVGANHAIASPRGLLQRMQAMEYERDRRYTGRKQGKIGCMAGGGSMFRVRALRAVSEAHGHIYAPDTMTEDWVLTYAIKHLGFRTLKPQDVKLTTIPVPEWRVLYRQRRRWAHGYIEALGVFGITKHTWWPWLGMLFWASTLTIWGAWASLMIVLATKGQAFNLQPWILGIGAILLIAKTVTVKRLGPRAMLLAAFFIPELVYSWWVTMATIAGVHKYLVGLSGQWGAHARWQGGPSVEQ